MNFIRENMVLMIIAGVVVVVGGGLLFIGRSWGSEVRDLVDERDELSRNLQRQAGGERISPDKIEAKQASVERLKEQADAAAAETMEWNRRDYEIIKLTAGDREVPAFPLDSDLYREYGLRYKFMLAYNDSLGSLVEPLRVTRPATPEQIESRAVLWEEHIQDQPDADEQPQQQPEYDRRQMDDDFIRDRGRRTQQAGRTSDSDIDVSDQARAYAVHDAMRQQAQAGLIYLSPEDALHNLLPEQAVSRAALTDELLWQAQVNLWVQQDILSAINDTNESFIIEAGGDPDVAGVFDSAVKRLVSITVEPHYYGAETQPGRSRSGGDFDRGRSAARADTARPTAAPQVAPTLTGRVTNDRYEVVQYSFTVVMRPEQKVRLMEKLMSRNCHAVLERRVGPVAAPDGQQSGRSQDEGLYEYGPAPVRQVTFKGELLLMVPWTRGQWDDEADAWREDSPPLTPVDVLRQIPEEALRDEDMRRVRDESGGDTAAAGLR